MELSASQRQDPGKTSNNCYYHTIMAVIMISSTVLGMTAFDSFDELTERKLQTKSFEFFVHVIVKEPKSRYGNSKVYLIFCSSREDMIESGPKSNGKHCRIII